MKGIVLILIASFAIRMLLMFVNSFQSDESIYVYAGYAISKGLIPYREILLAHPPLIFLIYSAIIWLSGVSLTCIRLFNVGLFTITIFQTYIFSKMLLENWKKKETIALIVSVFYGLFPSSFILLSIKDLLDILLVFFIMNSCIIYVPFCKSNSPKFLFLSGLFMGCSLITTIRAIFFILPMASYQVATIVWNKHTRRPRIFLNYIVTLLLGGMIPVAISLSLITFVWNALHYFLIDVFYLPSIIIGMELQTKTLSILNGLLILLPLTILALISSILCLKKRLEKSNIFQMLATIILSGIFLICILPPNVFLQYFFYLTPFISFMACISLYEMTKWFHVMTNKLKSHKIHIQATIIATVILIFFLSSIESLVFITNVKRAIQTQGLQSNRYDQAALKVANYILNVTKPGDKIWTSEGAIAFFSQRLVQPPNSLDWPEAGLFATSLGYVQKTGSWELEYRGDEIKDYHEGWLTINQFIQSWEQNKVKAIVFIRGIGWVPYPDDLIYEGFRDQQGAKYYIQQHYELGLNITKDNNNPNGYEVWIRK